MKQNFMTMTMCRLIIAFIVFASGVALSESLKSEVQYGIELKNKQESLCSIKEDTASIVTAFTHMPNPVRLTSREIDAFVPGVSKPQFSMSPVPAGTLSAQGNEWIVDRGIKKDGGDD